MFDVGFTELFLLSVIGLLVLGPERLPAVARTLGGFMRKARSSWYSMKRTIEAELAAADVTEPVKAAGKELKDLSRQIGDMGADTAVETDPEVHQDPQADSSNTSD